MSRAHLALFVVVLASSLPALGCSADSGYVAPADESDEQSSDALATGATLVPGVAAIEFSTQVTHLGNSPAGVERDAMMAAPSKVKKAMAALSKLKPNQPRPACAGPGSKMTRMTFRDAAGKELGHGEYSCSVGQIHVGGANIDIFAKSATIDEVRALAPLPGDILFGVDGVTIEQPGRGPGTKVTKSEDVKALVDAIDLDKLEPIDPTKPVARCLPTAVVVFSKGRAEIAAASFMCANPAGTTKLTADFSTPEHAPVAANGTTTIDPRVVQRLLGAH